MKVTGGDTDVTTYFALRLAATGVAATGLDVTTFDLQYVRTGVAPVAKVDATALAATDSAHADNKAFEIDATDQPGLYRVDWPDAAFAAGVRQVILTVKCASCFTEHLGVDIDTPVNLTKILGTAVSTPATAGVLDTNVKNIANAVVNAATAQIGVNLVNIVGVAQSATDLKDFADTGYDPVAHKVQGVVLADGCTANTDMRGTDNANTTTPPTVTEIQTEMEENGASLLDTIRDELANETDGLSALKALIDTLQITATALDDLTKASGDGDLASIKGTVETIPTTAMRGTDNASTHDAATVVTAMQDAGTVLAKLLTALELDGAVYRFTENALEEAPSGTGASAAVIADAVWDELASDHETTDTMGRIQSSRMGKWEIDVDNNQLKCYGISGDLLFTYDLKNASGNPTSENPYSRTPA